MRVKSCWVWSIVLALGLVEGLPTSASAQAAGSNDVYVVDAAFVSALQGTMANPEDVQAANAYGAHLDMYNVHPNIVAHAKRKYHLCKAFEIWYEVKNYTPYDPIYAQGEPWEHNDPGYAPVCNYHVEGFPWPLPVQPDEWYRNIMYDPEMWCGWIEPHISLPDWAFAMCKNVGVHSASETIMVNTREGWMDPNGQEYFNLLCSHQIVGTGVEAITMRQSCGQQWWGSWGN